MSLVSQMAIEEKTDMDPCRRRDDGKGRRKLLSRENKRGLIKSAF
jgi:hypothetical protein